MIRILFIGVLVLNSLSVFSQKEDYNWVSGFKPGSKNIFRFNPGLVTIDSFQQDLANFTYTNASISDENGDLIMYSNGRQLFRGDNHGLVENGDSINYNLYWENRSTSLDYEMRQGLLFLTLDHKIVLIQLAADTMTFNGNLSFISSNLQYSTIVNDPLRVIEKNKTLITDTLFLGGMTACKHGNGRDWWVICSEGYNNCFYKILVTPDSLYVYGRQCLGEDKIAVFGGIASFSPDGSKLVVGYGGWEGIGVFDFNRCNGELTLNTHIPRTAFDSPNAPYGEFQGDVLISPNSQFLYSGSLDSLYRWELNAPDVLSTQELVHFIDFNSTDPVSFVPQNLGPDGRMYCQVDTFYHTLNNPDEIDISLIEFNFFNIQPSSGAYTYGNFPNYRLGPLTGSPCDTLGVGIREINENINILLYPNPAKSYIEVDYGYFPWQADSKAALQIYNLLGEQVHHQELPQYSAKQYLHTSNWSSGVYLLTVTKNGVIVGKRKFMVE